VLTAGSSSVREVLESFLTKIPALLLGLFVAKVHAQRFVCDEPGPLPMHVGTLVWDSLAASIEPARIKLKSEDAALQSAAAALMQ
jgi:hypothetical protein